MKKNIETMSKHYKSISRRLLLVCLRKTEIEKQQNKGIITLKEAPCQAVKEIKMEGRTRKTEKKC